MGIQPDPVKIDLGDAPPINSYILVGVVMIVIDDEGAEGNVARTQLGS